MSYSVAEYQVYPVTVQRGCGLHTTSKLQQPKNCTEIHLIFLRAFGIEKHFRVITLMATRLSPKNHMPTKRKVARKKHSSSWGSSDGGTMML